ncbi:TPA: PAS domain-containing protein [Pseudomonas putida]|nr:PAS domain-containing protein [Pseudomonas putida]
MNQLALLKNVSDAIAALLYPNVEAVVHDRISGSIVHIANPQSNRRVGDPSLISDFSDEDAYKDVIGPYKTVGLAGKELRSITVVARGDDGGVVAYLCLNFDDGVLGQIQGLLANFTRGHALEKKPAPLFKADWRDAFNGIVGEVSRECSVAPSDFTKREILRVLSRADEQELFQVRGFVDFLGKYFGLSRATVYNYIKLASKTQVG